MLLLFTFDAVSIHLINKSISLMAVTCENKMNENRFVCVGQVLAMRDEEFNNVMWLNVEVVFNENERGYFRFKKEMLPEGTKFMSTIKLMGSLRGRTSAKTSTKGTAYVAETMTPVVQQVELVK